MVVFGGAQSVMCFSEGSSQCGAVIYTVCEKPILVSVSNSMWNRKEEKALHRREFPTCNDLLTTQQQRKHFPVYTMPSYHVVRIIEADYLFTDIDTLIL